MALSRKLDLILVDDDLAVCEAISETIKSFYCWGDVLAFTDISEAIAYCRGMQAGIALFVVDVYLGEESCFSFLDAIADKFSMVYQDTIIVTGNASNDVVNMCVASNINYLIEKPIRVYSLQLAIRAIISKYILFAKRLLEDPDFAESVAQV